MSEIKKNTIALIGMTGCGKTSVGIILSKMLSARFVDLDFEIEKRYGEIPKIFSEKGEGEFRKIECEVLAEIVGKPVSELTILSCGGGLPTYKGSREILSENSTVVWLRRSAESVLSDERILERPPICGDRNNYEKLLEERYPIYRITADLSFYNALPKRTAAAIIKQLIKTR